MHGTLAATLSASDRRGNIQVARSIACFLLVMLHTIGGSPDDGLRLTQGAWEHSALTFFSPMRMPLFSIISGCVYAMRPVERGYEPSFLAGKVRRILLPFVAVSTLFYAVQVARDAVPRGDALAGLPWIYLQSYEIFWFLQAIFLVFVVVSLVDRFLRPRPKLVAALIFILLFVDPLTAGVKWFSLWGAVYLVPFFLLGTLITRKPEWMPPVQALGLAFAMTLIAHFLYSFGPSKIPLVGILTRGLMGISGGALIISSAPHWKPLMRIGKESFPIYLFHIFFIVAARLVSMKLGLPLFATFLACLVAGLIGPMLLASVLRRWPIAAAVFLGERVRR